MAMQSFKFNKSNLLGLKNAGKVVTVKDSEVSGLKFKVGLKRSVFQFEKRISGHKGAPVTFTLGSFPALTVDDARQKSRELANLCEQGIDPRTTKTTTETRVVRLRDALDKFFDVKKELAKKTLATYREVLQHQFPAAWMDRDMLAISSDMLVAQFHVIRKTARNRCWKFLKLYSNVWNTCAPFFRDANGTRILGQSPIPEARVMLKNVRRETPRRSVVNENLLGKFVVIVERLRSGEISIGTQQGRDVSIGVARMCDMTLLSLFTAFRFTEVQHLKWEYVDLENGVIRLPGDARNEDGAFDGTKNHQEHWAPLSSYAWTLLRKIHAGRASLSPYVFPAVGKVNQPITRNTRVFNRIAELIGSHYSPHTARRTFASAADAAGLGYLTVKRLLNHWFQGGVTGGYVVPGFNPAKERANFQKVCDYILDRRAEYLGLIRKPEEKFDFEEGLVKLNRYAMELGIDLREALEALAKRDASAA